MLYRYEIEKQLKKIKEQVRCLSCKSCIELVGCEDGQVPMWDEEIEMWVCADMDSGEIHAPVTLNPDQPTQDSANLVDQELQLVPATETTYGVVKLEDIVVHDEVTLNADDPTQESLNLSGQEIQVNPATETEYGVVKLEDINIHDEVTLNADQPTQEAANLSGQELQLNPATSTTYGVVKLEDLFAQFNRVNTYNDLPDPTLHTDEYWHVVNSQGSSFWPGWIGGTFYSKGFYYSDGVTWTFIGEVPYQASQADVNAGIITDQFVSPATLAGATTVSHPGHTHVVADITDLDLTHSIGFGIKGGASVITTGYKDTFVVPYDCVITGWTILETTEVPITSSIVIDVQAGTYANYDTTPTFASIAGTEKPTITTSEKGQDLTLTTWTTTLTAGTLLRYIVDSVTDAKNITLSLHVTKT